MIFIYNALSVLIIGILFRKKLTEKRNKIIYLIFCFAQMALIQGLRHYTVGTDTIMYVDIYKYYLTISKYSVQFKHFEYGFRILYDILHFLKFDYQKMLFVISCITMSGFGYFIYKNSEKIYISTFIFACMLYPNSFNIIRQYLAIAIAINSYKFIIEKKYIKAICVIAIACFIHITAILMIVPFVLNFVKKWNIVRIFLTIISFICYIFGNVIVAYILNIFNKNYYMDGFDVNRLFRLTTGITIFIAFIMWNFKIKATNDEDKRKLNLLSNIAFVNMCMGILYLKYEFFSRIIELLNVFLLISIPLGLKQLNSYYKSLWRWGSYIIPLLLLVNMVFFGQAGIENYKMFFDN